MPIELKRDPYLWAFAAVIVLATFALVWHHDVTWKEGAAFVTGALAMPALFGTKKKDDDDNHDGGVTVPASDIPPPTVQQIGPKKLPGVITPITMLLLVSCAASPAEKTAAANATFAADQLACVDKSETRAEADACRAKVRAQWHVDAGGAR